MFYMFTILYEEFVTHPNLAYQGIMLYEDDDNTIISNTGDIIKDFLNVMGEIKEGDELGVSSTSVDFLYDKGVLPDPIYKWMAEELTLDEAIALLLPSNTPN